MVVGTENDGFAEGDGFEYVVYAFAEATAYVGDVGVLVEGGEHADIVDNKYLGGVVGGG